MNNFFWLVVMQLDYHPPGEADVGFAAFVDEHTMLETGAHSDYREVAYWWVRMDWRTDINAISVFRHIRSGCEEMKVESSWRWSSLRKDRQ